MVSITGPRNNSSKFFFHISAVLDNTKFQMLKGVALISYEIKLTSGLHRKSAKIILHKRTSFNI
jgi:hypothetical protein